jgi:hypothetical protein
MALPAYCGTRACDQLVISTVDTRIITIIPGIGILHRWAVSCCLVSFYADSTQRVPPSAQITGTLGGFVCVPL